MLCDAEHEIEILKNEQERIRERYLKEAKNLSEQRCKVAKTLGSNITKALEDLNFLDVRFEIEVTKKDQISADGMLSLIHIFRSYMMWQSEIIQLYLDWTAQDLLERMEKLIKVFLIFRIYLSFQM